MRRVMRLIVETAGALALVNYQSHVLLTVLNSPSIPCEYVRSYSTGSMVAAVLGYLMWGEESRRREALGGCADERPVWLFLCVFLLGLVISVACMLAPGTSLNSLWLKGVCALSILGHQLCVWILWCICAIVFQWRQKPSGEPV
ncbi:MAG: hypothetical protein KatS3mg023_1950 [Armatimonadota bacterium]|nr:MAG: hypothetical protein KatS3mg023_1950 [Armatimonadota bacterium]